MPEGTIVTVLGAGASRGSGFPLADDFFPRVKAWGDSLGEDCRQLRRVIDYVVRRAQELGCFTPDDLAFRMYQTRYSENRNVAGALLYYGRIVTDAFFLHIERQVTTSSMQPFKDYWHEVIGPYSHNWRTGIPRTKHRLVTFNYDRVAELAFCRYFPEIANNGLDLYGLNMLNTGFSDWRSGLQFGDKSFCFLKLHGSVGIQLGRNEPLAFFDQHFFHHAKHLGTDTPVLNDDLYFEPVSNQDDMPRRKFSPLVAFPVDKQHVESGGSEYNFKDYIDAVGAKARQVFTEAERIEIIGYSFRSPDKRWLVSLLQAASQARKFIINPHARSICQDLEHRDGVTNVAPDERRWGE
jgi:hypothetical protein